MIKIQENLDVVDSELYVAALIDKYWNHLNQRDKKKPELYATTSLIEKCRRLYVECDKDDYIKKIAGGDKVSAKRHKKFFMLLKRYNFRFLKQLIFCKPSDFNVLRTEIFTVLEESDVFYRNGAKLSQTSFGVYLLDKLFNYKSYRSSAFCVETYLEMGFLLSSCPYCNDRQIEIVKKNTALGKTPQNIAYFDLDHFYPKSQNPFFALSFYNLVPSCTICNSKEKGDLSFDIITHVHPYHLSFDDYYQFTFSSTALLGSAIEKIHIVPKGTQHFQNITDFNLEHRYDNRTEEIGKLIKFYQNYYKRLTTKTEKDLFIQHFTDMIPIEKKHILKKDRSKLFRDVLLETDKAGILGIIR